MTRRSLWLGVVTTCISLLMLTHVALSQTPPAPQTVLLWADKAPGAVGTDDVDKPSLTIYQPDPAKRVPTAVVVCPGGGYGMLALDHEGKQIADWLNSHGITAAVLRYRVAPRYHYPAPILDGQRAVRYVRAHATDYGVAPDHIGIWGFSAGGHLASTISTHFDAGDAKAADTVDRVSSRPDFSILAYPVISFIEPYAHVGSRVNLLGDKPDKKLVESLSNERQVTPQTPTTFLFHTTDDPVVPVENSVAYYLALRKAKVPAEFHAYEHGDHGVGLAPKDPILSTWPDRLADWLRSKGLIAAATAATAATVDVNGVWNLTGDVGGNPVTGTVTFKQDGTKLTGTTKAQAGEAPLTGDVSGSKVTWKININYQGTDLTVIFTGAIGADGTMTGTIDAMGFPGTFTAKKQ
jgi:acetyl esterase/lipase